MSVDNTNSNFSPIKNEDLRAAPISIPLYGRVEEINTLEQWLVSEQCRIVGIYGTGGIGKTVIARAICDKVRSSYEFIIWRSLQDALPILDLLQDSIKLLTSQQFVDFPEDIEENISILLQYFTRHRCLLILDNAESILEQGGQVGLYRHGYEYYGRLLERIGGALHNSCVLITSREKLKEISILEGVDGKSSWARSIVISGLAQENAQQILKDKGLIGGKEEMDNLVDFYSGNPLALKLIAGYIGEVASGNIGLFLSSLKRDELIPEDIRGLIHQQFERLSISEQEIMYWLGIHRIPSTLEELRNSTQHLIPAKKLPETLVSLKKRSIIEGDVSRLYMLQPVMEYVVTRMVDIVTREIGDLKFDILSGHPLIETYVADYIREAQIRLILQPVVRNLRVRFRSDEALQELFGKVLSKLRSIPRFQHGYCGGNIINLLTRIRGDLNNYNFSNLEIWQAYLKGISLHYSDFSWSNFNNVIFNDIFDAVISVGISKDGRLMATGDIDGEVHIWSFPNGKLLFECSGHTDWVYSVAFNRDNSLLASGSDDQTIRLWDLNTGQCTKILHEHTSWIKSVAFSPFGEVLASGGDDKTIKIWDIHTGHCIDTLIGHTNQVRSVAFSP
jgi:NB-ARC domain/WD domain, G-beta repeat